MSSWPCLVISGDVLSSDDWSRNWKFCSTSVSEGQRRSPLHGIFNGINVSRLVFKAIVYGGGFDKARGKRGRAAI